MFVKLLGNYEFNVGFLGCRLNVMLSLIRLGIICVGKENKSLSGLDSLHGMWLGVCSIFGLFLDGNILCWEWFYLSTVRSVIMKTSCAHEREIRVC
jgi:hypothetical protein